MIHSRDCLIAAGAPAAGEAAKLPFPVHVHIAAALDRMRTSGPRNGYQAPPAPPRARLDHKYGALHRNVGGAVQGHLALILRKMRAAATDSEAVA
jgi:hypothetical protein